MLREEDGIDEEVTNVESDHEKDKSEEEDDIEILGARPRGSKRVRVSRSVALGLLSLF